MGNRQGTARSKGSKHPTGLSGRTLGKMIRAFRETTKKK